MPFHFRRDSKLLAIITLKVFFIWMGSVSWRALTVPKCLLFFSELYPDLARPISVLLCFGILFMLFLVFLSCQVWTMYESSKISFISLYPFADQCICVTPFALYARHAASFLSCCMCCFRTVPPMRTFDSATDWRIDSSAIHDCPCNGQNAIFGSGDEIITW